MRHPGVSRESSTGPREMNSIMAVVVFGSSLIGALTIAAKIIPKNTFKNNCFGTIYFVKITKQSLYKANSFACSLANRDKPVAATLQRKCSGGIIFVIITKIITKIIVPSNYFVIISARMVRCVSITS